MNEYKFDKIIIESSPFLACIMTAAHIAKVLGSSSVTINYRATQVLFERYKLSKNQEFVKLFDKDPMLQLEYIMHLTKDGLDDFHKKWCTLEN